MNLCFATESAESTEAKCLRIVLVLALVPVIALAN